MYLKNTFSPMSQFGMPGNTMKSYLGIFAITNTVLKYIQHSTKHALSILGTQDVKDSGTCLQNNYSHGLIG